jgi:nitroreductase
MPDLFEIMRTTRSMRRLKPDPVPDEFIRQVLEARTCAANAGNTQSWRFLVVQDPEVKRTVAALYKRASDEQVALQGRAGVPSPGMSRDQIDRMWAAGQYLADHFHEAPVWIVPCGPTATNARTAGSSIYPAVQNMLLAARALGLGATLTTIHTIFANETDAAFGLPEGIQSYAILPIGYPMGNFGPVRRTALSEVVFGSRWGEGWAGIGKR